jgi:hypothetical protein
MHVPDIAWLALGGLVVLGLAVALFSFLRHAGDHGRDLGSVSSQWINEHRAQAQDQQRH